MTRLVSSLLSLVLAVGLACMVHGGGVSELGGVASSVGSLMGQLEPQWNPNFGTIGLGTSAMWQNQLQQPHWQQQLQLQQQPIVMPSMVSSSLGAAPSHTKEKLSYAQPIVTVAQPVMQQVDMTPPQVQKQHLQAQPIVQPTFQVAPVLRTAAISARAPTIQKGFGTSIGLGTWQNQLPAQMINKNINWQQQQPQQQQQPLPQLQQQMFPQERELLPRRRPVMMRSIGLRRSQPQQQQPINVGLGVGAINQNPELWQQQQQQPELQQQQQPQLEQGNVEENEPENENQEQSLEQGGEKEQQQQQQEEQKN